MSRSQLIDRAWILKMFARPSMSGRVNSILRSNRPGRINAQVDELFRIEQWNFDNFTQFFN